MVDVPDGKVVVGIVRFPSWSGGWAVVGPGDLEPVVWPLSADAADVARCFVGRVEGSQGKPRPSPWKWGEPEPSVAVELADRLVALDFDVTFVADVNRSVACRADVLQVPSQFGPVVRFANGDFSAMYSERPLVGWVLDLEWDGRAVRIPLEPLPAERALPAGQIPRTAEWLAGAAVKALVENGSETEKHACDLNLLDETPGPAEAVAWLRRCGLPADLAPLDGGGAGISLPGVSVILRRTSRRIGAPAIQADFGVASVEGRMPMIFSVSGFTRDAVRWAERAGIALWTMHEGRPPGAVTTLSKGLKPAVLASDCGERDVEDL
jgi:hypothetical protein